MAKKGRAVEVEEVQVQPPDFRRLDLHVVGTAPLVQLRFSEKAQVAMTEAMLDPAKKKRGKSREARDFDAEFRAAYYKSGDGHYGVPAMAFKNALLDAASLVGVAKTTIKRTIFVEPDGVDERDGTPLVFIEGDGPHPVMHHVRNASGVADIRVRAAWRSWSAVVRVVYDASILRPQDVVNLFYRAGLQVGIGEGRPMSKASAGMGWGTFTLAQAPETSE